MQQLRKNNAVFAAFKTHRMGRDMAAQLIDEKGELKSFERFKKDVDGIASHHVENWLRTEYDTAVKRAHRAAEMRQFIQDADVLPNIEWLPSTAVNPRETHIPFYHRIWSIDDPFWEQHKPGDEWGCQCGWAATDESPTDNSDLRIGQLMQPSPGLGGNPARTAQIFSDDHPYFPSECKNCPFKSVQLSLFSNRTKDCYNCRNITRTIERTEKQISQQRAQLLKKKVDAQAGIKQIPLSSPIVHTNAQIRYGTIVCSKSDIRNLIFHAYDLESIAVAQKMHEYLDRIRYVRTEDPKHPSTKKDRRGLIEYVVYELEVGKDTFIVKCEARDMRKSGVIKEHPYAIYKK